MKFGKIDYLNLLPFHVFLKRSSLKSYTKKSIEHKKDVPAKLNKALKKNQIDAAVISSIESRYKKYKILNMGIVAKRDVKSVLVRKNSKNKNDPASASSNMLAKILGIDGEVIIGDRALKAYLTDGDGCFYDLANIWHKKTGLPFVFGRLTCAKYTSFYKSLAKNFTKRPVKIPQYILEQYSQTRKIEKEKIIWYLKYISYKIKTKEQKSYKLFLRKARELGFKS